MVHDTLRTGLGPVADVIKKILSSLKTLFIRVLLASCIAINLVWAWPLYPQNSFPSLRDYGSFYASGAALLKGFNPYAWYYPHVFLVRFEKLGLYSYSPNLNPPISLFFTKLLARVEPYTGYKIWWFLLFGFYTTTVFILARYYPQQPLGVIWAFSLAGFWHMLELGQVYGPLFLLACLA